MIIPQSIFTVFPIKKLTPEWTYFLIYNDCNLEEEREGNNNRSELEGGQSKELTQKDNLPSL